MSWNNFRRSDALAKQRDDRHASGAPSFGTGLWGLGVAVMLGLGCWELGIDPRLWIGGSELIAATQSESQFSHTLPPHQGASRAQIAQFVASALAETRDVWSDVLPKQKGIKYVPPHLALYKGGRKSACGPLYTGMGPIYCPLDDKIYLDPSFFVQMKGHFGGAGNLAPIFMIAHEIGHRVQDQLGIMRQVWAARGSAFGAFGNAISIRIELMADCYAGVWAIHAEKDHLITQGDVGKMIVTAQAIGDDRLEFAALGRIVPNSFTHGTSAQRVQWFETGLKSGLVDACSRFAQ